MTSLHSFRTVAQFEMRTLLRSWFFRIFAGISIIGLGIFNATFFFDIGDAYIYKALPSIIPYANLLIINIGQAVVAIFLASEFLKQDKKNDTTEVIYARSMTNTTYILGKTMGILFVFLILNLFILTLGSVFVFLNNPSALSIGDLLLYPTLISFPTLLFVLGFSFFLMILLKNQAITFIVLLGYIAISTFYLNDKLYNIFDYMGYTIPMINSTIVGFGDIEQVLIHRGIYVLLGLGFIFFTIFKLNRLPQSKLFRTFPIIIALICFVAAGFLSFSFIELKSDEISLKKQMIALNDKYYDKPTVSVLSCNINLTHNKEELKVITDLRIKNNENISLNEFIFSLNPDLKIKQVNSKNKTLKFSKELQILKIQYPKKLKPNESCNIRIIYKGGINENTNALDQDLNNYSDNSVIDLLRVKKRYTYLKKDYVCLTRESLWYPISGVGFSSKNPAYQKTEFTKYTLNVKTNPQLNAISQGAKTKPKDGVYKFNTEYPLPQISLLIGNYIEEKIKVDSIEYLLYSIKGNDDFKKYFTHLNDTLPSLIKSLKDEYETKLEFEYPFKRLIFAEVPVQYSLTTHNWSITSDAIQPELILYPEKGVFFQDVDFAVKRELLNKSGSDQKGRWQRFSLGAGNEEYTETQKETMILSTFIKNNFFAEKSQSYKYNNIVNYNTYSIFPNYYTFITHISSKDWPMLNLSIASYIKGKNEEKSTFHWRWGRGASILMKEDRINLTLKNLSLKELLKRGLSEPDIPIEDKLSLNEIIQAKGNYLLTILGAHYGTEEFYKLIKTTIQANSHKIFNYTDLNQSIQNRFGSGIDKLIYSWYHENDLPGFIVKDVETYMVKEGKFTKFQVRFKISNPEKVDGFVTMEISIGRRGWGGDENADPPFTKEIFIPGGEAREVGFTFAQKPSNLKIFTHISQNLPHKLEFNLSDFDEERNSIAMNEIKPINKFLKDVSGEEIIVDNEDINFSTSQLDNKSYLKSLIDSNREQTYKYGLVNWWNAPRKWESVIRTDYYGKYIHSAHYTRTNDHPRTAKWTANIKEQGSYDIYCYLDKMNGRMARWIPDASYNFIVYSSNGKQELTLFEEEIEKGWNYLGTFYINSDSSIVELTNKSTGESIYADAIKWVKN